MKTLASSALIVLSASLFVHGKGAVENGSPSLLVEPLRPIATTNHDHVTNVPDVAATILGEVGTGERFDDRVGQLIAYAATAIVDEDDTKAKLEEIRDQVDKDIADAQKHLDGLDELEKKLEEYKDEGTPEQYEAAKESLEEAQKFGEDWLKELEETKQQAQDELDALDQENQDPDTAEESADQEALDFIDEYTEDLDEKIRDEMQEQIDQVIEDIGDEIAEQIEEDIELDWWLNEEDILDAGADPDPEPPDLGDEEPVVNDQFRRDFGGPVPVRPGPGGGGGGPGNGGNGGLGGLGGLLGAAGAALGGAALADRDNGRDRIIPASVILPD